MPMTTLRTVALLAHVDRKPIYFTTVFIEY